MAASTSEFVGDIPQVYDADLGPVIFRDFAADLARRAAEAGGDDLLELAAGTGILSRALRDHLPRGTRLVVTDLNPPMLDVASDKLGGAQDDALEVLTADAMALPFANARFDLILCQFGVMFFPDKVAAFREAMRVARPGARYLFNTWRPTSTNPFLRIVDAVVTRSFPVDPPEFYRVPPSYWDAAIVKADMRAGGWTDVAHDRIRLHKTVVDLDAFARGLVFGNPMIDEIRKRGEVAPEVVQRAIIDDFRAEFGPEPFDMPLEATVFSGVAPAT